MPRHCFALDLKDDAELIAEYDAYHRHENAWPEIIQSLKNAYITTMEIYRTGNRLFMIMEVDDKYTPGLKSAVDASEPKVKEWEALMDTFQQRLPWAQADEKWVSMKQIFKL